MFSIDDKVRLKNDQSIIGTITSIAYPGYVMKVKDNPAYVWPIVVRAQDIELISDDISRPFVYGDYVYIVKPQDTGIFLMSAKLYAIDYGVISLDNPASIDDVCYPRVFIPMSDIKHARREKE